MLQLVTAIIRPSRIDAVREVLEGVGVTVGEVHGYSRQAGHDEVYRGTEYQIELVPKLRLEILVEVDGADALVEALSEAARTGRVGDGKLWVTPIDDVVRVRTGEHGPAAI